MPQRIDRVEKRHMVQGGHGIHEQERIELADFLHEPQRILISCRGVPTTSPRASRVALHMHMPRGIDRQRSRLPVHEDRRAVTRLRWGIALSEQDTGNQREREEQTLHRYLLGNLFRGHGDHVDRARTRRANRVDLERFAGACPPKDRGEAGRERRNGTPTLFELTVPPVRGGVPSNRQADLNLKDPGQGSDTAQRGIRGRRDHRPTECFPGIATLVAVLNPHPSMKRLSTGPSPARDRGHLAGKARAPDNLDAIGKRGKWHLVGVLDLLVGPRPRVLRGNRDQREHGGNQGGGQRDVDRFARVGQSDQPNHNHGREEDADQTTERPDNFLELGEAISRVRCDGWRHGVPFGSSSCVTSVVSLPAGFLPRVIVVLRFGTLSVASTDCFGAIVTGVGATLTVTGVGSTCTTGAATCTTGAGWWRIASVRAARPSPNVTWRESIRSRTSVNPLTSAACVSVISSLVCVRSVASFCTAARAALVSVVATSSRTGGSGAGVGAITAGTGRCTAAAK